MKKKIVLVEDEVAIRENYASCLTKQGFEVKAFADTQSALNAFKQSLPDMAILDINLPDDSEGGFKLCQFLRQHSATMPIMFLTALDSDFDIISGLRLGADDYLTKDISLHHFMARVHALFRRVSAITEPSSQSLEISVGSLKLDLDRLKTFWDEKVIDLTLTEFWMVHALAKHPGHVKSRDQLMDTANVVVDESTITSHIKRIRKKFQIIDESFDAIDTVYGMGYRWKS